MASRKVTLRGKLRTLRGPTKTLALPGVGCPWPDQFLTSAKRFYLTRAAP